MTAAPSTIFLLALLASIVVGLVLAAVATRSLLSRIALAVLPALAVVVICGWWTSLVVKPVYGAWSGARLAPALGLRFGYPLYPGVDQGPVNGWIYPPAAVLTYLPATFLGDPASMIVAARGLSLLFVLGPLGVLLVGEWRRRRLRPTTALLLAGLFALLVNGSRPLRYVSTEVLADAAALGFGASALAVLGSSRSPSWRGRLTAAAALATMAAWSKQLAIPLLAVVPLWALATHGGRAFRYALATTALVASAISVPIALLFGPQGLWFDAVVIPSHHPWQLPDVATIGDALARTLGQEATILAFPVIAMLVMTGVLVWNRGHLATAAPGLAWRPFLLAAVVELPMAVAGYAKLGGDVNSLAHVLHPLSVAAVLLVADAVVLAPRLEWLAVVGTLALLLPAAHGDFAVLAASPPWYDEWIQRRSWIDVDRSVTQFLRTHPGEGYFPTYPLEHLAVEGRLPHFEHGVFDRAIAGFPLTPALIREHVPHDARYLCYPMARSYTAQFMRKVLPEFDRPVQLPELPDTLCFERSPPPSPP